MHNQLQRDRNVEATCVKCGSSDGAGGVEGGDVGVVVKTTRTTQVVAPR